MHLRIPLNLLESTRAIFASGLSANDKLVALALLNHWSRARDTFPGVDRLVVWTSLSRRSVLRSIRNLETTGAVKVERKVGLANRYDLTPLEALTSATGAPVPEGHQCQTDTPPVPEGHGSSATQAPDQCHTGTRSDPVSDPTSSPGKGSKPRRSAPAPKATKPRGLKKAKPEPRWPAAHTELTKRYFELFEQHRGTKPFFRSREGKAVGDLLDTTQGDVELAATLIDNGLTNWDQATILTIANDPSKAQSKRAIAAGNRGGVADQLAARAQALQASEKWFHDPEKGLLPA